MKLQRWRKVHDCRRPPRSPDPSPDFFRHRAVPEPRARRRFSSRRAVGRAGVRLAFGCRMGLVLPSPTTMAVAKVQLSITGGDMALSRDTVGVYHTPDIP